MRSSSTLAGNRYTSTVYAGLLGLLIVALLLPALNQNANAQNQSSVASVETADAIFAGGCFWCVESDFDAVPGVLETISGYTGGTTDKPTYKNHHQGMHREVVRITYDPSVVTYEQLLHVFWRSVDPTDDGGQFCDRGHSYTTAIYATTDEQLALAQSSKADLDGELKTPVVTPVEAAADFWAAEGYHQNYYQKNPWRYKYYRNACGRDKRVKQVWGAQAHSGIDKH